MLIMMVYVRIKVINFGVFTDQGLTDASADMASQNNSQWSRPASTSRLPGPSNQSFIDTEFWVSGQALLTFSSSFSTSSSLPSLMILPTDLRSKLHSEIKIKVRQISKESMVHIA